MRKSILKHSNDFEGNYLQSNSAVIPKAKVVFDVVTVTVKSKRKIEANRSSTLWLIKYQFVNFPRKSLLERNTIKENELSNIPENRIRISSQHVKPGFYRIL